MTRRLCVLGAIAFLVLPAAARAQGVAFEFADTAGQTSGSFTVTEGQTVQVRVYLRDPAAGAPTLNGGGGLGSTAVRLSYGAGAAATVMNPATDAVPAVPPWEFGTTTGSDTQSAVLNLGVVFAAVRPGADGRVLLGTFTLTGVRPGEVTLTAADPNPTTGFDTSSFDGTTNLDPLIGPGTATLTVTPVPEPAAVLGVSTVALGLTLLRSRRRSVGRSHSEGDRCPGTRG